jgi:hypothetical protein
MSTDPILALLIGERDKLTGAIEALQGPTKREGRPPGSGRKAVLPSVEQDSKPPANVGTTPPVKRKMSAAGRRAIIMATKKRWAAAKAARAPAAVAAQVAAAPNAPPARAPASAKPTSSSAKDAVFRKKMSERMKKAWAAGKRRLVAKSK